MMSRLSEGELKLVSIMETYGSVKVSCGGGRFDYCSFRGSVRIKGTWTHVGYRTGAESPVAETYLALDIALWNSVKELSGQ
jgi:hypothetical protein